MAESTTLTIRLTPDMKDKLGRLSVSTRRSRSFLAAEAVAAYVARESAIVAEIEESLDDMRADRVIPHDAVMAEMDAIILAADRRKG